MNSESDKDERSAASDTYKHHDKPSGVAKDIARRNLIQKAHTVPYERQMLEQNTFSGLRCFGSDELCRHFGELFLAGGKCCSGGADKGYSERNDSFFIIENNAYFSEIIKHLICIPDNLGYKNASAVKADDASDKRRRTGIADILHNNLAVVISQSLQSSYLRSVLIDHPCHSCGTDKRGHNKEDQRKNFCNALNHGSIVFKADVARILASVKGVGTDGCTEDAVIISFGCKDCGFGFG